VPQDWVRVSLSPFRDLPDHQSCDFLLLGDRFPGPPAASLPTCLPTSAPIVCCQTAILPTEGKLRCISICTSVDNPTLKFVRLSVPDKASLGTTPQWDFH
ncbi:mCG144930, partial [Mus musculus]